MLVFRVAVVWVALCSAAIASCTEGRVELRGEWGQARFNVEIADTAAERSLGLMNRENMASAAGMLFLYENPQTVNFWMQNTLIALDMIFVDEAGVVRRIHENAIPLDRTAIPGGPDILAVLEINGGMSALLGIDVGTTLRHPGLPQGLAAWPCE
ncbi:MAG: uncharacterized membrane protein (UPF0127 family) [Paracoccaceae bacterium]|jgi:uncharacterized membrane protein (UPF0127 family)